MRSLFAILDQELFFGLNILLDNKDVNRDWHIIGSKSLVRVDIVIVEF